MNQPYVAPEIRYGKVLYEHALSFRKIALAVHENPSCITKYLGLPSIDFLLSDDRSTTLERTEYLEAFSYGDPGVLLAAPGPSLSGIAMRELGTSEQIDYFYRTVKNNRMRTCFALTESEKGSDAARINTRLIKKNNRFYLRGNKCFFGNGAVAELGVAFAKISENPVGIRAILLTPSILNSCLVEKDTLPQFSLRGAQIAVMRFNDVDVPEENILGRHLSSCSNGLLAIIKIFNQFRTGVGALAIGQAQAVYDHCYEKYVSYFGRSTLYSMSASLSNARNLLRESAIKIDDKPLDGLSASIAKLNAVETAESVVQCCFSHLSFDVLMSDPWILKSFSDVFSWEYMEGTAHIHRNQISRQLEHLVAHCL